MQRRDLLKSALLLPALRLAPAAVAEETPPSPPPTPPPVVLTAFPGTGRGIVLTADGFTAEGWQRGQSVDRTGLIRHRIIWIETFHDFNVADMPLGEPAYVGDCFLAGRPDHSLTLRGLRCRREDIARLLAEFGDVTRAAFNQLTIHAGGRVLHLHSCVLTSMQGSHAEAGGDIAVIDEVRAFFVRRELALA